MLSTRNSAKNRLVEIYRKRRSLLWPACPLPPERQRYFDTFSRLYLIATATHLLGLLPMLWLLGSHHVVAVALIGLVVNLAAYQIHRRGYLGCGVVLLLAANCWLMLEALRTFGTGLGFELYFAVFLLVIYISDFPRGAKVTLSGIGLALMMLQLVQLRGGPAPALPGDGEAWVLMANLVIICVLFGVILSGLEGVTERLERDFRREASHDALTGVLNRRALIQQAQRNVAARRPFALLMVDIDHFKRINDEHGHEQGDRALCHVVECLRMGLREQDVVGRYGGEEFIVIVHDMTLDGAHIVAKRLADQIRRCPYTATEGMGAGRSDAAKALSMTVSIGVAVSGQANSLNDLIVLADQRLYRAKRAGRDRVVAGAAA